METPRICEINLNNEFLAFNDDISEEDAESYSDKLCEEIERLVFESENIVISNDGYETRRIGGECHEIKIVSYGPQAWYGRRKMASGHSYALAHFGEIPEAINDLIYAAQDVLTKE